jgi:hypothetical protein
MKYPRYQIDYSKCVHLLKADAASRAREEGRRIAAYIKDALPDNWIGEIVGSLAAAGLPMVKAWTASRKAISEKEAGKKILHVTN